MKKFLMLSAMSLLSSFSPPYAFSQSPLPTQMPFIGVTLDTDPGEIYHLGYLVDSHSMAVGVYFENTFATTPGESLKTFTLEEAKAGVVINSSTSGSKTYDLVSLELIPQPNGTDIIGLTYLRNGLFGTYGYSELGVRYNSVTASYESFSLKNKAQITTANLIVNYVAGRQVGIARIDYTYAWSGTLACTSPFAEAAQIKKCVQPRAL